MIILPRSTSARATSGEVSRNAPTRFVTMLTQFPDFGIFLAFCVSNWMLVYFFIYTVRVKGWSFGFGKLFGALGKLVGLIKKPFQRKKAE